MPKKNEIEELKKKVTELTEALQRERADATNVRRRAEEDRTKLASFYKVMICATCCRPWITLSGP
jgi:molecular chaperone GrpE (heat shock protein)